MNRFTAVTLILSLFVTATSWADFGEVDLMVRESVHDFFANEGLTVDLSKFEYIGEPRVQGDIMTIRSSVWAEQFQIAPYWGWYDCSTNLKVSAPGEYSNQGTTCFFDFE